MISVTSYFGKNFLVVACGAAICLSSIVQAAVFRVQGRLKDPSGTPLQGNVYVSKWPEIGSPPSQQEFSPVHPLGSEGEFDIQFEIGTDMAVAFHHFPIGHTPGSVNDVVRKWNNEFRVQLAEGGQMFISRNGVDLVRLSGEDIYNFCGLEFSTRPFTEFLPISGSIAKNDWDGTRGWCPEDYDKLSTIVSHTFPYGNLLKNGSFELNPISCPDCTGEGWDMSSLAINYAVPEWLIPRSGKKMAHVRFESSTNAMIAFHTDPVKIKPNTSYTLAFYYRTENPENWDSEGARPMVRTYGEDGTTEVVDMVSGSLGVTSYFENEQYGSWTRYVHRFRTGPSAHFAKVSLIRAASSSGRAEFYFDDVLLIEGTPYISDLYSGDPLGIGQSTIFPSVKTIFSNPMGRGIQTRTDLGETSIFSDTRYDGLWRPILSTLPVERDDITDDFFPFITSNGFFPTTMGYLNYFYPEAGGYPFSEIQYEDSPVGRTLKQSAPGEAWNINGDHVRRQFFSTTSTLEPTVDLPPPAAPTEALFAYHLQIGEGGETSRTFTDKAGKVVRTSVKSEDGWINTDYEHDISGKVEKIKAPPGPNGAVIETEFDYDSQGNLLSEKSPDLGQNLFIYNDANRLRFTQTQAQREATPSRFSFVKYDLYGRPTETGEYLEGTQFTPINANNGAFPSREDIMVRISSLNFYDRLPPNRNYCLEGGLPSTIIIRDDAPEGSTTEFREWDVAYNFVRNRMATITSHPGNIQFFQVFNSLAHVISPPLGRQYTPFTFSDNVTKKEFKLTGILRGGSKYQQLVSNYPFALNETQLEGRLALTVNCNLELSATQLGVQQIGKVFNYDKYGNVTEEYEFNGHVRDPAKRWQKTSMGYDVTNRLISKGTYATVAAPQTQFLFRYAYDLANRLSYITLFRDGNTGEGERVASITYDARGLPVYTYVGPEDFQRTLLMIHDYNIRGWIETINAQWQFSSNKYLESLYYENGTNPQFNGNISTVAYTHAGENTKQVDYTYDALNRLKSAQYLVQTGGAPPYSHEWFYNYHPNGSINSVIKEGQAFSYGYLTIGGVQTNRLGGVGFTGPYPRNTNNPNNFTYDASGKMTSDLSKGMVMHYGSREVPYQFDYEDGTEEGTQVMVYAGGTRKSKFVFQNGEFQSASHYFSNGKEIREINQAGADVLKEIHPFGGHGRMVRQPSGSWDTEYFIRDHLGSTVAMQDVNGNITYKTDYEPFGKIWQETQVQGIGDPLTEKFTGKEHDKGIDLDYFGARYYDADLGLWISPDPAREFHSPYAYSPDPINGIDPDGRDYTRIVNGLPQRFTEQDLGHHAALDRYRSGMKATAYAGALVAGAFTAGFVAAEFSPLLAAGAVWTGRALYAGVETLTLTTLAGGILAGQAAYRMLTMYPDKLPIFIRAFDVLNGYYSPTWPANIWEAVGFTYSQYEAGQFKSINSDDFALTPVDLDLLLMQLPGKGTGNPGD